MATSPLPRFQQDFFKVCGLIRSFLFFMAKTKAQKQETLTRLQDGFANAKSIVFVAFDGTTVQQVTSLRQKCEKDQVEYVVAKKTLMNLALKQAGYADVDTTSMPGSVAVAFSAQDEVLPVKLLAEMGKTVEALKLVGGIVDKKSVDVAMLKQLATLPSKQELLAKVVGSIASPLSGFVRVLAGPSRSFVCVLKALSEKKAKAV